MSGLDVKTKRKYEIVWSQVVVLGVMHIATIYVLYLRIFCGLKMHWSHIMLSLAQMIGITVGYHRLWSHKTFKASRGLEILLLIMTSSTYQNSCYTWARDHRLHHKHSETDADPHNANRGFFFSHVGWLCVRKHPAVKEQGKFINMSDLEANPLIMFQHKYYHQLVTLFTIIIPTYFWYNLTGHSIFLSLVIAIYRMVINLHVTWGVNSFAHLYGMKPYTKVTGPTENLYVIATSVGEGFHNYHHTFPHDYRSSRNNCDPRSIATIFIDVCKFLGLASDLKIVPTKTSKSWADKYGIKSDYDKAHTLMAHIKCYAMFVIFYGYII